MSAMRTLVLVFGVFVPPYLTLLPKLGHCPSNYDGPVSDTTCSWDNDCPDGDKCCVFNNGGICVPSIPIEKLCPLIHEFGICVELCSSDDDCTNGQMCCSNGEARSVSGSERDSLISVGQGAIMTASAQEK
ncbi:hypothetical protein OJAV_G00063990 [Oryzias javanicus]|uniref:WAP domain-containing protein n=1 Tax=Oryzias javanicus TaxID=123683 RepID=A0A437D5A0_ORYJA|nr:hypothetical protein OJAV_G00063990 [Oryzias javanicus]